MQPLEPGMVLAGRYRLDAKLGEGGMGVVWAATHVVTRQAVAVKLLLPTGSADQARFVKRFMREARAASAVKHPNVVVVYDVMELEAQTPMMVMELLHGETLGQLLHRQQRLALSDVARVLLPVVSALGTAHAAGIVHRDVKPDNIFLAEMPEGTIEVKVLDFGIAKLFPTQQDAASTGTLTATNSIVGTPYYMAPEQVFGEKDIDHRADVWAIGVIAYECLAGVRPATGENIGQVMKIIATHRIVPVDQVASGLPGDVTAMVMGALSAERNERPSLQEVKAVLARYTNVHVRDFTAPQAPLSSVPSVSSGERVARPISDSSPAAFAPTIESGERSGPVAESLDAGVTRLDPSLPVRTRHTLALAVIGIAAASALTLSIVSRTRPVAAVPSVAPVTSPAPTFTQTTAASETASAVASSAQSSSAAIAKHVPVAHVSPSASASTTTTSPTVKQTKHLETGGVVETVPY